MALLNCIFFGYIYYDELKWLKHYYNLDQVTGSFNLKVPTVSTDDSLFKLLWTETTWKLLWSNYFNYKLVFFHF